MLDRFAEPLELLIPIELFERLPYQSDYKYEYFDGRAVISYRPRMATVRLAVLPRPDSDVDGMAIRPVNWDEDRGDLIQLFVGAFARTPPMDTIAEGRREEAAAAALDNTRDGGDGLAVPAASFVAIENTTGRLIGAALVTFIQLHQREWPDAILPPRLCNLTWLFVSPWKQRDGVATALVARVVNALAAMDERWLVSHFERSNSASLLFHWRSGFELLSDGFSRRRLRAAAT